MSVWQLQEAKGRFSELVKRALSEGPQDITVRGEPVAVLISRAEYARLVQPRAPFVEFMRASPLAGAGIKLSRTQTKARKVSL
ncbi:MAG: type II toxin-antitoxin system Phd/YefM family antitoxin [Betaproteobacteria bacterium]|nr:type II toxin-antitoxin system Phd/YefM family antitoxin [Betaproteobacteria bacterium]